jgi:hypothetical protein
MRDSRRHLDEVLVDLKDAIKPGKLKNEPRLVLDTNQVKMSPIAPEGFVAGYQRSQSLAVYKGHTFQIHYNPFNTLLGHFTEEPGDILCTSNIQWPAQCYQVAPRS